MGGPALFCGSGGATPPDGGGFFAAGRASPLPLDGGIFFTSCCGILLRDRALLASAGAGGGGPGCQLGDSPDAGGKGGRGESSSK